MAVIVIDLLPAAQTYSRKNCVLVIFELLALVECNHLIID